MIEAIGYFFREVGGRPEDYHARLPVGLGALILAIALNMF